MSAAVMETGGELIARIYRGMGGLVVDGVIIEPEMADGATMLADALTNRGITVFSMKPNSGYEPALHGTPGNPEFRFPSWTSLAPSSLHYAAYEPGDGLAVRMGRIAAIDLDFTSTEAIESHVGRMIQCGVMVLAWELTPRGGAHVWTLGHGRSKGTTSTADGNIDYQGEGALLFVVGSSRPKYARACAYSWVEPPNWALLDDATTDNVERNGLAVDAYLASVGMGAATSSTGAVSPSSPAALPAMPSWLQQELGDLSEHLVADRSARFHYLVAACRRAGLTEVGAVAALTPWCEATGKYVGNVAHEVSRSWEKVAPPAGPSDGSAAPGAGSVAPVASDEDVRLPTKGRMDENEFWAARDYLTFVRQRAHAKTSAPYALLLAALVRVSAELRPCYVLPDIIGSQVSLNYYGILIDGSGGGKSSILGLSHGLYDWTTEQVAISSGEGLVSSYVDRKLEGKTKEDPGEWVTRLKADRLFIAVDESEGLLAIDSRYGNTLMSNLRTLWTAGGEIGSNNKAESEKVRLGRHEVRTGLIIGGQPVALGRLFVDEGRGTAERFVTIRLQDPSIPREQPPSPRGSMPLRINELPAPSGALAAFAYDRRIEEFIIDTHWYEVTGNAAQGSVISPERFGKVSGHRILIIAKTAALFAAWDGRMTVSVEDWALAVHFVAVSLESRRWGMDLLTAAKASENDDIGAATGHRQAASDEVADSVKVGKVVKAIILLLKSDKGGSGTIQQSQVRSKVGASLRMHIASAVDLAVGDGRVIVVMRADASGRNGGDTAWLELGPNA